MCANTKIGSTGKPWTIPWDALQNPLSPGNPFKDPVPIANQMVVLKRLGCSDSDYDTARYAEVRDVSPTFNWFSTIAPQIALGLGIPLAVSLAVYGIVRAIGWVIGGFAAS